MKRSAVVAVIDPHGNFLVLRRSASDPWKPHHWNFPGGGVEPHETMREGAVRELYEEAGVESASADLHPLFVFQPKRGHQVVVFATRRTHRPEVHLRDGEHDKFVWAPIKRLPSPTIPHFKKVAKAVALRLLDIQANMKEGKQGDSVMSQHYNTSKYMAHWPLAIPYPYAITRSRGPVPNASSVDWPQAQFAPLYLPPGSPSFQRYGYRSRPKRYPPGADVFSIFPGPNRLRYSTKLMSEPVRRWGMRRADGDLAAVPGTWHAFRARVNSAATKWKAGDPIDYGADKAWGATLSPNCKSAYLARIADAKKKYDKDYPRHNMPTAALTAAIRIPVQAAYVQAVLAAQTQAVACMDAEAAAAKEDEFQMLREQKVGTQQTAEQQMDFQQQLVGREAELMAAEQRTKLITYGVVATFVIGGGILAWRAMRG